MKNNLWSIGDMYVFYCEDLELSKKILNLKGCIIMSTYYKPKGRNKYERAYNIGIPKEQYKAAEKIIREAQENTT